MYYIALGNEIDINIAMNSEFFNGGKRITSARLVLRRETSQIWVRNFNLQRFYLCSRGLHSAVSSYLDISANAIHTKNQQTSILADATHGGRPTMTFT